MQGTSPSAPSDKRRALPHTSVFGEAVEGLLPLRMDPPAPTEGLRPASFSSGLDEITVGKLRANGEPAVAATDEGLLALRRRAAEIAGRL